MSSGRRHGALGWPEPVRHQARAAEAVVSQERPSRARNVLTSSGSRACSENAANSALMVMVRRCGSRLGYARAVLPAPQLSPRTTTSAHAASARARPGSAGGTLRAALASERPQAQRRGSHLQFLSKRRAALYKGEGHLKSLSRAHLPGRSAFGGKAQVIAGGKPGCAPLTALILPPRRSKRTGARRPAQNRP